MPADGLDPARQGLGRKAQAFEVNSLTERLAPKLPRLELASGDVLAKRVAVVGGTGDIGRALARTLASHGANVVVVGQTFRDADVPSIEFIEADLSLMSDARRVAAQLLLRPSALSLAPQDIPVAFRPGVKVRVVAGQFGELCSPMATPTAVDMLDVSLEGAAELHVPVAPGCRAFLMPIPGSVVVDDQIFGLDDLKVPVYPARDTPYEIKLHALRGAAKVMFVSGAPLQQTSV